VFRFSSEFIVSVSSNTCKFYVFEIAQIFLWAFFSVAELRIFQKLSRISSLSQIPFQCFWNQVFWSSELGGRAKSMVKFFVDSHGTNDGVVKVILGKIRQNAHIYGT